MWGAPGAHDGGKELLLGIPRSRALWYRAHSQPLFLALWGLHGGTLESFPWEVSTSAGVAYTCCPLRLRVAWAPHSCFSGKARHSVFFPARAPWNSPVCLGQG